ncbi:hypothetical protein BD309DRAFT_1014528 [Dichomitus squalens]|uniref:Uncharacterized protein n=1 Tax=Dichomitus squalens TaxID=114155 RepID=A0A4Q9Q6J5_9APHY|nr:uncharacterized protein DICSQDRAFT_166791 [Dichomitus squalens LYAD-421 SS1]EJF64626.1 hypothetical protein DICSQDRAFT_166791 [Dichomitus squalens LYAD-421 SS1]TBU32525.1 hypothetical protein BD311DRAFT_750195 [Dichomitus squalens]TBU49827.1 hypothetical protein BD309DRAFT_1014528 [Dichomitus squalens]TBU63103.1 hypothetical protein BD310DRAFT_945518 [Dichomitus squalens]
MPGYQKGDQVEYRPIGGAEENVAHSTGVVEDVFENEDGQTRYAIKNDNTGKSTNYQEMNIVRKI